MPKILYNPNSQLEPEEDPSDAGTPEMKPIVLDKQHTEKEESQGPAPTQEKRGKSRRKIRVPIRNIIGMFLFCVFLFSFGLGCGVLYYGLTDLYPYFSEAHEEAEDIFLSLDENSFSILERTRVYDKDGNVIAEVGGNNCVWVDIEDISPYIQRAYLAMEDRRFYEHDGIDLKALFRAGLSIVRNRSITQGGSTITQQIIKNNILSQEQTFDRKAKELFMAPWVDATREKSEIMAIYCNTNYYANGCYGVEAASRYYFGKSASEVSLSEAAILASLSARPSGCDPKVNYDSLIARRDLTLSEMLEAKLISQEEYDTAIAEEPVFLYDWPEKKQSTYVMSYAISCAALHLMEQDGFVFRYLFVSEEDRDAYQEDFQETYNEYVAEIRSGGYEIYTSIDMEQQELLQNTVDSGLASNTVVQEDGQYAMQGAAVVIDNETGYVTAIVGGRGTEGEFNRAFQAYRQPASVIKPLLVFGPAYEAGYTNDSVMSDEAFLGGPKNAYGSYLGDITLHEALVYSTNTIAYKLLQQITVPRGMAYLEAMEFRGITYHDTGNVLTALGGFDYGCRVVDIARGYGVLANRGIDRDRDCVVEIQYRNSGTVYQAEDQGKRIYSENTANQLTEDLVDVLEWESGTGYSCRLNGIKAAAKTGTTNDVKDAWFAGYSAYYTVVVWTGYDMPEPVPGADATTYSGRIWKQVMEGLHR